VVPQDSVPLHDHSGQGASDGQRVVHGPMVFGWNRDVHRPFQLTHPVLIHPQGVEKDFGGPSLGQVLLVEGQPAKEFPFFNGLLFPQDLSSLEVCPAEFGLGEGLDQLGLGLGELRGVELHQDLPGVDPASHVHMEAGDLSRDQRGDAGRPVFVHRKGAGKGELRRHGGAAHRADFDAPGSDLVGFEVQLLYVLLIFNDGCGLGVCASGSTGSHQEYQRQQGGSTELPKSHHQGVSPHKIPPPAARSSSASSRFQSYRAFWNSICMDW